MRILALAPHIDDIEFGCGGTIHRLIKEGHHVKYVAFSDCKNVVPERFSKNVLRSELYNSVNHLGINKADVKIWDYTVRQFNFKRQDILENLIELEINFKPNIVFTPATKDIHQDHTTVTKEAIRAFKRSTIYGYELPWNLLELPSTCLFKLSLKNIDAKINAISEYKSQAGRSYCNVEYIRALALTRGTRIGVPLAEAFEVIRLIQ